MSVTVTKGEGVTVITLNSKVESSVPLLCQLLWTMCYTPACFVSQALRKFQSSQLVLGTMQIMIGVFNISIGAVLDSTSGRPSLSYVLGGMILASGILCILAVKFPSACLVAVNVILNLVVAALALAGIGMCITQLTFENYDWNCDNYNWNGNYNNWYQVTKPPPSPDVIEMKAWLMRECGYARRITKTLYIALNVMLILLAVLQLCVNISSAVLGLMALTKSREDGKRMTQDLEQYKPLLEEVTTNPAAPI
ncbi:hypothetical protein DPEC_G00352360 [Dallia pectoralis]|uniref:Uncharacterized protein n=1 Tax=Dallia pectoralis TaxID=75939 RepID=A0ACC2F2L3_DALPE|nr:hypothetical protein DPEC_G00352360 [Dallia pectoralis]